MKCMCIITVKILYKMVPEMIIKSFLDGIYDTFSSFTDWIDPLIMKSSYKNKM